MGEDMPRVDFCQYDRLQGDEALVGVSAALTGWSMHRRISSGVYLAFGFIRVRGLESLRVI